MAAAQSENKIGIDTLLAGKYRVSRELGRGGMAAVYEAEHVNIGKRVAVKVLSAELASSAVVIERFFREARAAASVRSPHIVEVYDSGRLDDGRPFIAMELLEGESLYDRMATVRLFDADTTVRIISQVAKGLMKAHAAGIVHRDLKPENIHLCRGEDGEEIAKILDFGLAKFYAPVQTDEKTARLTREGAVFGTPAYMSPEQVKGQGTVDQRADLWALGCMAFECLTGRPVWNTDQGVAMTFAAIAASQLPTPSRLRPDLPPPFDAWFKKALQRDPDQRFQTARQLAEELAKALGTATPPISLANVGSPSDEVEVLDQHIEEIAALEERRGPSSARASNSSGPRRPWPPANAMALDGVPELGRPAVSATDPPPTASPEGTPPPATAGGRSRAPRAIGSVIAVCVAAVAGGFLYARVSRPVALAPGATSTIASGFIGGAVPSSKSSSPQGTPPPPETPKWMGLVEQGQQLLASGDSETAMRKFKEAVDVSAAPLAKSFLDHTKVSAAATGPCKLVGLSHPRLGYGGAVGRPAVAVTSKGAIVAWTDDHERPGHDHVYSVLIDETGRPTSSARDLTPEADCAMRPALLSVDDRIVLLFWDKSGREPGVRVRWLDADGRIGGMSAVIGAAKAGLFWPAIDRAPDGGFWVAWQDSPDKEGEDLFLRRLDSELRPVGGEVRATDYEPEKGKAPRVSVPSVAVSSTNLFVAYALERERQHIIERMRLPLASADLQTGLQPGAKGSRELGEVTVVNEDRVGGDYPSLACTKDACFLVWHEVDRGAQAALVDPTRGSILWRKRFDPRGGHPAVASTVEGRAEVAFYEGGRVRVAAISRDGVGTMTTFARVSGDQPRPWIAPGRAQGEWYVAWLDLEAGHTEAFAARLQCRN